MRRVGAPSAWSSPSDLDKKESDGRDPPQGVAPHAHRGVVGAPDITVVPVNIEHCVTETMILKYLHRYDIERIISPNVSILCPY